jgi:signal transduction protein with GAF and PtsI domain
MFLLKFVPAWFPAVLVLAGILGYLLLETKPGFLYQKLMKMVALTTTALGFFIFGMVYVDHHWRREAETLLARATAAEASAKVVNTEIKEKVIVKREYYKTRGRDIVEYVDREIVKYDNRCEIPNEFVEAHNKAATR